MRSSRIPDWARWNAAAAARPWTVGLAHPRMPDEIIARFALIDGAVSTAGDYERAFFERGERYHHILDPKTGYPARRSVSATIRFAASSTPSSATAFDTRRGVSVGHRRITSTPSSVRWS